MNFSNISKVPNIIDGKPAILQIVEYKDNMCHHGKPALYIKGRFGMKQHILYAKTNIEILRLFFQGRLTVKELFKLGNEYIYYIEKDGRLEPKPFDKYDVEFACINLLDYDDYMFYSVSEKLRCKRPFEILNRLETHYGHK